MHVKTFIISILLMATASGSANAQTTCASVDDVWLTLSVIRDIEFDRKKHRYKDNIQNLETLANKISLPALISPEFKKSFPDASEQLSSYVTNIRQAVAGANAGDYSSSRKTLSGLTSGSYAKSILVLQNYQECAFDQPAEKNNAFLVENSTSQASSLTESEVINPDKLISQGSKNSAGEERVLDNQNVAASNILYNPVIALQLLLLTIFTIISVILTVRFLLNRRFKHVQRQERHMCNKVAQLKLGREIHAATILDIAMNGMKIQHFGALRRKRTLRVLIDGQSYKTRVKWLNASFAGVQFKKPISAENLHLLLDTESSCDPAMANNMLVA